MTSYQPFAVPSRVRNRLRQALRARGHEGIADQLFAEHPAKLGPEMIVGTGGGCEAYFVDFKVDGQNVLVVWTSDDGSDLATESDYRAGVYLGEKITEDALVFIASGDQSCKRQNREKGEMKKGVSDVLPDWAFDEDAIFSHLSDKAKQRTGPENVSDTIDAIKRYLEASGQKRSEQ